jgi:hypothetical protein
MSTTTLLFVLIALVLLLSFTYIAARRTKGSADLDQALTTIQSLDIEAFRNLVDPEEEAFLRSRLPAQEFTRIKRERALAALAYAKALSHASLQLARFGDAAQRSPDPAIAASGRQIAESATYLRLRALDAHVQLTLSAAFPGLSPRPLRPLLAQYDRAAHLLENHNGLMRLRRQVS